MAIPGVVAQSTKDADTFLLLELSNGLPFWQIGTEGGFLPAPLQLSTLLLGPAEGPT